MITDLPQLRSFGELDRAGRLVCRFHSGVNLKGYANQQVHVVVKAQDREVRITGTKANQAS